MSPHRLPAKSFLVLASILASVFILHGGAAAESFPTKSAVRQRPMVSCSVTVWVDLVANQPAKRLPTVGAGHIVSTGGVRYTAFYGGPVRPAFCGSIQLRIEAQREVCGFWGCNWRTEGSWGFSGDGRTSSPWTRSATQPCREGTHKYRTRVVYESGSVQFEWQQPVGTRVDSYASKSVTITCVNGR